MGASGRGGKSADPLGGDEGVATEHDRNVMVPADEAAALVVIEAELALELLVDALCLPPLLDGAHDELLAHATRWFVRVARIKERASSPIARYTLAFVHPQ